MECQFRLFIEPRDFDSNSERLMSFIQSQFLDLTAHHARYAAIDPKSALKDSASDKVIFISAASRGIGRATAVAFAKAGAKAVYLTARSKGALEETRNLVREANLDTQCAYSAWHAFGGRSRPDRQGVFTMMNRKANIKNK